MAQENQSFPIVLKPDAGERGDGKSTLEELVLRAESRIVTSGLWIIKGDVTPDKLIIHYSLPGFPGSQLKWPQ